MDNVQPADGHAAYPAGAGPEEVGVPPVAPAPFPGPSQEPVAAVHPLDSVEAAAAYMTSEPDAGTQASQPASRRGKKAKRSRARAPKPAKSLDPGVNRRLGRVIAAAVALVAAAVVFAFALMYAGGLGAVTGLLGTLGLNVDGAPPADSVKVPASVTTTRVPAGGAADTATVRLPEAALRRMFYEQIASQQTISELLDNKWKRFEYRTIEVDGDVARVRVTGEYRQGGSLESVLVLHKYGGKWYFHTITAAIHEQLLPTEPKYDPKVMKAIVAAQYGRQDALEEILDGTHNRFEVLRVTKGAGTKTVVGIQTGTEQDKARTEIVALSKVIDGERYWFLAGFRQVGSAGHTD